MKKTVSAVAVIFLLLAGALWAADTRPADPEGYKLHRDAIVCDLHADTHFMITYMGFDITKSHFTVPWGSAGVAPMFSDIDIPRARAGGLDVFNISICPTPKDNQLPGAAAFVRRSLKALEKMFEKESAVLALARTPEEARAIVASGRHAVFLGVEGGQGIEEDLDILREYRSRGVAYMTLTHAKSLTWAESASDGGNPDIQGLSDFGREVVKEMARLHMIVDLAHVSEETFWAVLDAVDGPVVVTHAAARGIAEHPRNLTDAQLKAVAERGGVIGVIFYPKYLDPEGNKPVTVGLVADHIDYIKKVAGIDVIALGSDYDGSVTMPPDFHDASLLPNLTYELRRRGYTDDEIRKVLGENFLRAWAAILAP